MTYARYFHVRVDKFLKTVLLPTNMRGNITLGRRRRITEQRHSAHTHLVFWGNNAPVHGVDPDEEVIEFIDSFITADSPVVSSELIELQRHLHTQHCNGKRT